MESQHRSTRRAARHLRPCQPAGCANAHAPELDDELESIVRRVAAASHRRGGPLALDDLVQIGRLAARAAVASHDGRSAGRTSYVRQAVVWRIRDAYRRESREPQPSPSAEQFDADLTSLARRDFANEAIRRLDAVRAMRQLRPEYRRVLFELQVLDRSWHDAARERGLSLNALKALHQRALEQLRRLEAA